MSGIKQTIDIHKGFASGDVIQLKGHVIFFIIQGYLKDSKKNSYGDHYVKINVKIP